MRTGHVRGALDGAGQDTLLPAVRHGSVPAAAGHAADGMMSVTAPTSGLDASSIADALGPEARAFHAEDPALTTAIRHRRNRARLAAKRGDVCGECGRKLSLRSPVWYFRKHLYGEISVFALFCRRCTPLRIQRAGILVPCVSCKRPVGRTPPSDERATTRWRKRFCSKRCEWRFEARRRSRHAAQTRLPRTCARCGAQTASRKDSQWCSGRCRQAAYRARRKSTTGGRIEPEGT